MTRGKAILLSDKNYTLETVEFNGDMGIDMDKGKELIKYLKPVNSEKLFRQAIALFNKDNFDYSGELFYQAKDEAEIIFKNRSYYDRWFSDYLYFLNIGSKPFKFADTQGKTITIQQHNIAVFYFGKFIKIISIKKDILFC